MRDFTDDMIRTEERRREVTVNGTKYILRATDPFGFWHVEGNKEPLLEGSFTTYEKALRSVEAFELKKALEADIKKNKTTKV